jgi:hypothetical protein
MAENLAFGFKDSAGKDGGMRLSVSSPPGLWEEALARPGIQQAYKSAYDGQSITARAKKDGRTLLVNGNNIREIGPSRQERIVTSIALLFEALTLTARLNSQEDPLISVTYGGQVPDPLWMEARVKLPELDDKLLKEVASDRMRDMATNLRLPHIATGAYINRSTSSKQAIVLAADDDCNIGISSETFEEEVASGVIELTSNNLDTHQQQLICLAGAVALAHAEELV